MIDVFLSRPTWVPEAFKPGLDVFMSKLSDLELNSRTLGTTDYPTKSPLDEVINIMDQCKGAIILGYPQIVITEGTIKQNKIDAEICLPTEWNHIEAGLAYAKKLPLVVIHHVGISRGIFDRGALNSFIFEKDFTDPVWSSTEEISGAIRAWKNEALNYNPTTKDLSPELEELERNKNIVWTITSLGRNINDPKPRGVGTEQSAECRIEEITSFYIQVSILSSGERITIPIKDLTISYDDKRHRPKIELRAV